MELVPRIPTTGSTLHDILAENVARRRGLDAEAEKLGYTSVTALGFDGPWVSPIQKISGHPSGPLLLAKDWLDAPSLRLHHDTVDKLGYLPGINFNRVLDKALSRASLRREDVYITQCFSLIVPEGRSASIPIRDYRTSFEAVTRHELKGRHVLALGPKSAQLCREFQVPHTFVKFHPSARGVSDEVKVSALLAALDT